MIPIGKIIKDIISKNASNDKFLTSYLQIIWKNIVGNSIEEVSKINNVKKGVLTVLIFDEKIMKILPKLEKEIIEKINYLLGGNYIKHIIFKKGKKKDISLKKSKHSYKKRGKEKDDIEKIEEAELIEDGELRDLFNKAYNKFREINASLEDEKKH